MSSIIIASHGHFAEGILESSQMIIGEQEDVRAVVLLPSEGPDDLKKKLEDAVASLSDQEEVLFLVDLWGGTPFNQASALVEEKKDKWAIVAGLNLAMVVGAISEKMTDASAHDMAKAILKDSRESIRPYPEDLEAEVVEEKTIEEPAVQGAIPPGTVIGDGKLKVVLARVDTRLLHGQVATSWTKATKPDRIIVVSDGVAGDELRKSMIMNAAPPGVKAHVVPLSKMCEVIEDTRFGGTKAMLLFETPEEALDLIEAGLQVDALNIGSMAHSKGKVVVSNAVAMDKEDIETLEAIRGKGVKLDVRKVPGDSPENVDKMLAKAKSELNMK